MSRCFFAFDRSPLLAAGLLFLTLLLSSCATTKSSEEHAVPARKPQADCVDERAKLFNAKADDVANRLRAACVAPKYKPYFSKTACLPAGITDAMTADKTKITQAQKKAAEEVFSLFRALSEETRTVMLQTGLPEYIDRAEQARRKLDPLANDLQNRLLSGKITWGQYNAERKALACRAEDAAD